MIRILQEELWSAQDQRDAARAECGSLRELNTELARALVSALVISEASKCFDCDVRGEFIKIIIKAKEAQP